MRRVVWFSCGAASAVASKLAVERYGKNCQVVYCDTLETEHPDNFRFFMDVEKWIGLPITKIKSEKFDSIDEVFEKTKYMSGIAGARCTVEMKKIPRVSFQKDGDVHIFGYTHGEEKRAYNFEGNNPELKVEWLLIENRITKEDCFSCLEEAGIALPAMYALGFNHNNCLGCVKATSPSYWNKIREHFPEVFKKRAAQSRTLGVRLTRVKGERIFLDELAGFETGPDENIECGPVCHDEKLDRIAGAE